jgi:hypothetical protein
VVHDAAVAGDDQVAGHHLDRAARPVEKLSGQARDRVGPVRIGRISVLLSFRAADVPAER